MPPAKVAAVESRRGCEGGVAYTRHSTEYTMHYTRVPDADRFYTSREVNEARDGLMLAAGPVRSNKNKIEKTKTRENPPPPPKTH